MSTRAGFTMIELLVVIALLGVLAAVSGQSIVRSARSHRESLESLWARHLESARSESLRSRRAITIRLIDSSGVRTATALPDGSIVLDANTLSLLRWDRLTGAKDGDNHPNATDSQ
jgi:prepilin-type N-terminal cleavage/methylation domain-containing protein